MKVSNYNYIVKHSNRYIWFNGFTGQLFSLNKDENIIFNKLFSGLDEFNKKYPKLFERMQQQGFIIDNSFNELDEIRLRNRKAIFLNRDYSLFINPTLECNFNCWYCYEEHPKGYMSVKTNKKIKKHIEYMIKTEKILALNLQWFGGEPLLYFNEIMYDISYYAMQLAKEHKIRFSNQVTTNGYLLTPSVIKKAKEIKLYNYQITLDGNEERHNKIRNYNGSPSFRTIVNNIIELTSIIKESNIILRINYDNQTLKNIDDIFQEFNENTKKHIKIDYQRVWQTTDCSNNKQKQYLEKAIKTGKKYGFTQRPFQMEPGKTHSCYVDRYYHAEFNYDGKIYKCTARGYDDKYVVGELKEDGRIELSNKIEQKTFSLATFENKTCLNCKHLCMCPGPCSQNLMETGREDIDCVLTKTDYTVEDYIKFLYNEMKTQLKTVRKEETKVEQ